MELGRESKWFTITTSEFARARLELLKFAEVLSAMLDVDFMCLERQLVDILA